jgi:hypothetical protein
LFSEYVLSFGFITFTSTILLCHLVIKTPSPLDAFMGWDDIPGPTRVVEGWGVTRLINSKPFSLSTQTTTVHFIYQSLFQNQGSMGFKILWYKGKQLSCFKKIYLKNTYI